MLIDSNILVYTINSSSPKHLKAQEFLQENSGRMEFAHQNIFETIRVLTHPKFTFPMKTQEALEAIRTIANAGQIVGPDYKTAQIALELVKEHSLVADQVFDAYLAATALSNEITTIATGNSNDFQKFIGLKIINPFE